MLPALKKAIDEQGGDHIVLIAGGVIPLEDYSFLKEHGCSMVFGPGTKITDASNEIIEALSKSHK